MFAHRAFLRVSLVPAVLLGSFGRAPSADLTPDVKAVLDQLKQYVGSEVCKTCHLEHADAWNKTLHSRMLQNAQANKDALIVDLDEKRIREDLKELQKHYDELTRPMRQGQTVAVSGSSGARE